MISFIVPTHNYGRFLNKCVLSIFNNNSRFIKEVLIINDSSTDNTDLVVKKLRKKFKKIKYYKKNYKNLAKIYNFGISKSKSDLICKIDADDFISKNFLQDFVKEIKLKKLDFIYGNLVEFFKNKKKIIKQNYDKNHILKYPLGSGTIFKKKLWKRVNGFNEKLYYQDDFDFWLKIKKEKSFKKGYIDKSNYFYRKHNNNMSRSIFKKNYTKLMILLKNLI